MIARTPTLALAFALGCWPTPTDLPSAGSDGGIPCPGTQCPCPCAAPLFCGPHNACTKPCTTAEDCGGAQGETCLGGLCGISCRPGGPDDCGAVGMGGATCREIQGAAVCSYPLPEPEVATPAGADSTGAHQ